MVRYWEDEGQTESVMRRDEEGTLWMYTGDEGIMDEQGYLKSECLLFSIFLIVDVLVVVGRIKVPPSLSSHCVF